MVTHIVETTYQVVSHTGEVITPRTVRVRCGREWPIEKTTLHPPDRICRNCERAMPSTHMDGIVEVVS